MWDGLLVGCVGLATFMLLPCKALKSRPKSEKSLMTISLTAANLSSRQISGVPAGIIAWTERPARNTNRISVPNLLDMFERGGTFYKDPPNAVISSAGMVYVVVLTGCSEDDSGLVFTYKSIGDIRPDLETLRADVSKHCVITIDNWFQDAVSQVGNAFSQATKYVAKKVPAAAVSIGKSITSATNNVIQETASAFSQIDTDATKEVRTAAFVTGCAVSQCLKQLSNVSQVQAGIEAGSKLAKKTIASIASINVSGVLPLGKLDAEMTQVYNATKKVAIESAVEAKEVTQTVVKYFEEEYCEISVSIVLGTLFAIALFDPETTGEDQASVTPLSALAVLKMAGKEVADEAIVSCIDMAATALVTLIWPAVGKSVGEDNKKVLTDGISFAVWNAFEASTGALIIPASCDAVLAGIVTTLVAQLCCKGTLPKTSRQWGVAIGDNL